MAFDATLLWWCAGGLAAGWIFRRVRGRLRERAEEKRRVRAFLEARPESVSEEEWVDLLLARTGGASEQAGGGERPPIRSFRDLVENPKLLRRAAAVAAYDGEFQSRMLSRMSVAELATRLADDDRPWKEIVELRARDADEVAAAVTAALADRRAVEARGDSVRGAGVVFAAQILGVRAATPLLAAHAGDAKSPLRVGAVEALAWMGDAAGAEAVAAALTSGDEPLVDAALAGLDDSSVHGDERAGLRDDAFVDGVVEPLAALLRGTSRPGAWIVRSAPQVLVRLVGARAVPRLVSRDVLRADHANLRELLRAIPADAGPGAAAEVRRLLEELPAAEKSDRAAALVALGRVGHPDAEPLARAALADDDPKVRASGAAALCAFLGLVESPHHVFDAVPSDAPARRAAELALRYCGEISNGGHEQYFFNSAADDWRDAAAALAEMDLRELAACHSEACSRFGPEVPSADRVARQDQLSRLSRKGVRFDDLDRRVWALRDEFATGILLHAARHPDSFRRNQRRPYASAAASRSRIRTR